MSEIKQATTMEEAINELTKLPVTVEQCGSWLWISGDTKPHREELKSIGCRWASRKKIWYWRDGQSSRAWFPSSNEYNMEAIRADYGSKQIQGQQEED